jgi:hypothetical protein
MTNAVDVLIVGGSANGTIVCMPLDSTRIELGAERYTPAPYTMEDGKAYWIAYPFSANPADIPSDATTVAAIQASPIKPAWDLNRPPISGIVT